MHILKAIVPTVNLSKALFEHPTMLRSSLTQWDAYKLNLKLRRTVSHKKWLSECRWNPCSVSKNVIDWLDLFDLFWMDKELHSAHGCQIRWKIQKQNSSTWYPYPLQTAANHGKINLSVMALRSCTYGPLFCPWIKIICIRIETTET